MDEIKSVDGVKIQPFDVIKNTVTDVVAIVIKEKESDKLVVYNDVIKFIDYLDEYPERQWEILGSLLTYWCKDTLESKKLEVIKEESE